MGWSDFTYDSNMLRWKIPIRHWLHSVTSQASERGWTIMGANRLAWLDRNNSERICDLGALALDMIDDRHMCIEFPGFCFPFFSFLSSFGVARTYFKLSVLCRICTHTCGARGKTDREQDIARRGRRRYYYLR